MFKRKAVSGLNVQDREIKRSVKNVPFVICLPAPGAGVHSSYEYTQLIQGCSLPAEPPQLTQPRSRQTPRGPCSLTLAGGSPPHTHTGTLPLPKPPSRPRSSSNPLGHSPQRTLRPLSNTPALLYPFSFCPLPTHQLPHLTPWDFPSVVPQPCTSFSGTGNGQDNTLGLICLSFFCPQSTKKCALPSPPHPNMSYIFYILSIPDHQHWGGGHVLVCNPGIIPP